MLADSAMGLMPPMDADKDAKILALWSSVASHAGISLTPATFFGFIGSCKVLGVLGMWGVLGPDLDPVANVCYLPILLGAAYTHHAALGDSFVPPLVFFALASVRLCTPPPGDKTKEA